MYNMSSLYSTQDLFKFDLLLFPISKTDICSPKHFFSLLFLNFVCFLVKVLQCNSSSLKIKSHFVITNKTVLMPFKRD